MSSRSSSSIESMRSDLQQLHMIAWGSGSLSHWALYVPKRDGSPEGKLIHIGIEEKVSGSAIVATPHLQMHNFRVTNSAANRCFEITGARATLAQVSEAAQYVHTNYRYNILTANCQNFAMSVLLRLNQLYPSSVTANAIRLVRSRGTVSTFLASLTHRSPLAYPSSHTSRPPRGFVIE